MIKKAFITIGPLFLMLALLSTGSLASDRMDLQAVRKAEQAIQAGKYEKVIELLEKDYERLAAQGKGASTSISGWDGFQRVLFSAYAGLGDRFFQEDNKYSEAINYFQKAVQMYEQLKENENQNLFGDKTVALTYFKLGFSLGEKKQWDEGLKAYKKGAKLHVDERIIIPFKTEEAKEHYRSGMENRKLNYDLAIHEFLEAQKLEPDNPRGYHMAGRVALRKGDYDSAINYFNKALKVLPSYDSIGSLGEVHFRAKNWGESYLYNSAYLALFPGNKFENEVKKEIAISKKNLNT